MIKVLIVSKNILYIIVIIILAKLNLCKSDRNIVKQKYWEQSLSQYQDNTSDMILIFSVQAYIVMSFLFIILSIFPSHKNKGK